MKDIILDTIFDSLKMLPFLFLSYLIIEYIEKKSSKKIQKLLSNSGKFGPIIGSLLGCLPQCGFSVTASNLYACRVISIGTLISVFLTTSDEAIPVLISNPGSIGVLLKIILIKLVIGIIFGFIIDYILRKKEKVDTKEVTEHIHHMCENCDCDHSGVFKSAIKHTINIFLFILIASFILNVVIWAIGDEMLSKILMSGTILQPFIASLIGLIPNCASSVLLTELYLSGNISFASIIAGLSSGSGIGLIVLLKENKNLKENLKILLSVYIIGTFTGLLIELIGII